MNKEQIVKQLRDMARHPTVTLPRDCEALKVASDLIEQAQKQEPVAWRDHVEQRLLTWRQSFVNKSGDQLALDDFMDKRSLDDLIDFVCDEYTAPQPREPLTDEQVLDCWKQAYEPGRREHDNAARMARAIEAAHGIKGEE